MENTNQTNSSSGSGSSSGKWLIYVAVVLGALFILLAGLYWVKPAGTLPTYIPGFEVGSNTIHFKHGLGSLIVGLALFAYAWFKSGKKG